MTSVSPAHADPSRNMACVRKGSGTPLVFLPGLTPDHREPEGAERQIMTAEIAPFAGQREVWWIQRPAGLARGVPFDHLVEAYAAQLAARFDEPVDVLGHSTGGSIALQLAADHPSLVNRLVLVSAAARQGERGRRAQRRIGELLARGKVRHAGGLLMSMVSAGPVSRWTHWIQGWRLGAEVLGTGDPDLFATIDAEDGFDMTSRLGEVAAPTLIAGGRRDAFYSGGQFERTARLLPRGRVKLYPGRGHMNTVDPALARDVLAFLDEGTGSPYRGRNHAK